MDTQELKLRCLELAGDLATGKEYYAFVSANSGSDEDIVKAPAKKTTSAKAIVPAEEAPVKAPVKASSSKKTVEKVEAAPDETELTGRAKLRQLIIALGKKKGGGGDAIRRTLEPFGVTAASELADEQVDEAIDAIDTELLA